MMRQEMHEFVVATRGRGFYEVTQAVSAWVQETNIRNGLLTLHLRHTSASLLIQENADPEVRRDLERFFPGWLRTAIRYLSTPLRARTICQPMFAQR
jgi:secondary thiamine-phosphate synthase enzyme